jgi:predicted Rossmann fold nucleotide-binding protein DprA/Smf involved in DNA uptake
MLGPPTDTQRDGKSASDVHIVHHYDLSLLLTTGVGMANILGVSAITDRIEARITQIEEQLKRHRNLSGELERLRSALARLEGEVRTRVSAGRRGRQPASPPKGTAAPNAAAKPTSTAPSQTAATPKSAAGRASRGQNKAKILEALKDGPKTASEITEQTGIGAGTTSTTLSKMAKAGELVKAERGYTLPQ